MSRNIALVGMMGAGKSTVARALGRLLSREVVETDHDIEQRAGQPVRDLLDPDDQTRFRELERDAVVRAARRDDRIIALGGGAMEDGASVAALTRTSVMVYLECDPAVLAERLGHAAGEDRPLLRGYRGPDLERRLGELVGVRRARYEQVADVRVDAGGAAEDTAREIARWARDAGGVLTPDEIGRLEP